MTDETLGDSSLLISVSLNQQVAFIGEAKIRNDDDKNILVSACAT